MTTATRLVLPVWIGSLLVGVLVPSPIAAQKVFTVQELDVVERTAGEYFDAVVDAIDREAYDDAKAKLIVVREYLDRSWTFWHMHGVMDGADLVRDAVARLDALDDVLSHVSVDPRTVAGAVDRAQAACKRCHATYRSEDRETKTFSLRPGVIALGK